MCHFVYFIYKQKTAYDMRISEWSSDVCSSDLLALSNFFREEKILQLREIALKQVASQVLRKIDLEIPSAVRFRKEVFLACISANDASAKKILRKTARLSTRSEEHTPELQSLMRLSYAVFCLKKKTTLYQ